MKFTIFAHSHCTDGLVAASIMKYSLQMHYNLEPVDGIARLFSGGGHKNASGGTCSLDKFKDLVTYN